MSPEGGLLDIHVTSFVSAIDSLLTAGRSNAPSRVLAPMKAVVNAVTAIIEDVRIFERRKDRTDVEADNLRALRERAEATLSNLVAVSKTHATSMGLSPVSLLDAASSHLSATVTDIGKVVFIRKASKIEHDQHSLSGNPLAIGPFSPSLRSIDEMKSNQPHQRSTSSSSLRRMDDSSLRAKGTASPSPAVPLNFSPATDPVKGRSLSPSSSTGSSPPPLFDQSRSNNNTSGEDSAPTEGPEEVWAELKVCYVTDISSLPTDHHFTPSHILKPNQNPSSMPYKAFYRAFGAQHLHRL